MYSEPLNVNHTFRELIKCEVSEAVFFSEVSLFFCLENCKVSQMSPFSYILILDQDFWMENVEFYSFS